MFLRLEWCWFLVGGAVGGRFVFVLYNLFLYTNAVTTASCGILRRKTINSKGALGAGSLRSTVSTLRTGKNKRLCFPTKHCLANDLRLGSGIALCLRGRTILLKDADPCSCPNFDARGRLGIGGSRFSRTLVCTRKTRGVNVAKRKYVSKRNERLTLAVSDLRRAKRLISGRCGACHGQPGAQPGLLFVHGYQGIRLQGAGFQDNTT